ncbi:MAG: malto-oligosyltrehalose trehalohydrolase, partial [Methanococcaceae archaeon]
DRLLLVNFGIDLSLSPAPEPLLAPPEGMQWKLIFSTEDVRYGGCGTVIPALNSIWRLQGNAAIFLKADYHKEGKNE